MEGRLYTRNKLSRFVCNAIEENRAHLFLNCNFARLIWNCQAIPNSIRLNLTLQFNEWLNDLTVKVDACLCYLS